ncbi:MAG: LysM peptidoglycan-binding domain-containing protein [Planctomycetes bacterium]|uniref:LysM peptidoglycan-binding domain-containing protein n=1 Tax=Candidatus Wunengus californicus TaxID=3367619 RepID=UPI004027267E|nr:LysM peptidoglycan-binding domain-containing protein [Planctomycetota bacterium]MBI4222528.1 LysM peptidoglycan-binding domain-containing protein [Planctomycetota bacterium]
MKKYFLVNTAIPGSIFLSLLMGGCALQPTKAKVPAQLEREIKTIEDVKSTTAYQPPISGGKTTYTVKKGDTLWHISKSFGVSVETILRANHITNTKDLEVGQILTIPNSGKSYTSSAAHSSYAPVSNVTGGVSPKGFIWPVKGQVVSQFNEIRNGIKNMGIYILPQPRQNVVAAKKGTVEAITDADDGTLVIVIKHDGGTRTIYGCRSNPMVGEGSYVEQGQPIASISQTGTGKPPEINFKIYVKDKPVNPLSYLP